MSHRLQHAETHVIIRFTSRISLFSLTITPLRIGGRTIKKSSVFILPKLYIAK